VDLGTILKVVHAVLGLWIVAGLIGRWTTLGQARRATDIGAVHTLLRLSDRFEWVAVRIPPVVLLLGVGTAIAQGRPFLGPFQGGSVDWLFVSIVIYLSVIPLVPLVFIPRGKVFAKVLADATESGVVTEELTARFRDPVVFAAHVYELGVIVVVFVLMITKPF
jgi:hypothetical protein